MSRGLMTGYGNIYMPWDDYPREENNPKFCNAHYNIIVFSIKRLFLYRPSVRAHDLLGPVA